jgi:hypothetical protein
LSAFQCLKKLKINFKIYFTAPFDLENYLLPNKYDWHIAQEDICYNSNDVLPLFSAGTLFYESIVLKKIKRLPYKQIHFYSSCTYWIKEDLRCLFTELFKPAPKLISEIEKIKLDIQTNNYATLQFRFLNLLGDFNERDLTFTETEEKRKYLIQKSIAQIYKMKKLYPQYDKFFVASDSKTFLDKIQEIPFVFIAFGHIAHSGYEKDNDPQVTSNCVPNNCIPTSYLYEIDGDWQTHLKTFIDFFTIAGSKAVFCLSTGKMYAQSTFAKTAAAINDVPFKHIKY